MEARFCSSSSARKVATVPRPQERVKAMPQLQSAKTVAWGLERCGRLVDTVVVHSDNCAWRDMACSSHYGCCNTSIVPNKPVSLLSSKLYPQKHSHCTAAYSG